MVIAAVVVSGGAVVLGAVVSSSAVVTCAEVVLGALVVVLMLMGSAFTGSSFVQEQMIRVSAKHSASGSSRYDFDNFFIISCVLGRLGG